MVSEACLLPIVKAISRIRQMPAMLESNAESTLLKKTWHGNCSFQKCN